LVEQLQKQGSTGLEALKDRAQDLEQEAGRLRQLAASVHQRSVLGQLVQSLEGAEEKIDLFHAALLVAKLDQAELEVDSYRQQVADMAREVSGRFPASAGDEAKLTALVSYLFTESGFHGSRHDYYNRANSHINDVLDDREGIPITLSILFLELAQRLGLSRVSGLPLPGHFMVRFAPAQGEDWIIDVFNGGRRLTRTEAQEQIIEATGKGFRDEDYQVAAKRQIILRMLRNLIDSVERDGSGVDGLRYLDAVLALSPDSARDRLNRARLRLQATDTAGAKEDFRWLLDHHPDGIDLERIAEVLRSL
jgi:regulator of sirC expression with transglutaminase-like and TPR domain